MDKLKKEKLGLHEVATRYIVERNNFKKEIEDLKSENEKNIELEEVNSYQYNNYEERLLDLT